MSFIVKLTPRGAPKPPAPKPIPPARAGQEVWWIDQSGQVTPGDALAIVAALNVQTAHLEQAWPEAPKDQLLHVYGGTNPAAVPPGAYPAYFLLNPDQAGVLGYHDVDPMGRPYVKVFTEPTISHGGTILEGSLSVAVTASHEACELWGDRSCVLVERAPDGRVFAKEFCDACEAFGYPVTVTSGQRVWLSDFVLPQYFGQTINSPVPWPGLNDIMGKLSAPWSIGPNCYAIIDDTAVFGEGEYPEWKKALKEWPASRTARRGARLA